MILFLEVVPQKCTTDFGFGEYQTHCACIDHSYAVMPRVEYVMSSHTVIHLVCAAVVTSITFSAQVGGAVVGGENGAETRPSGSSASATDTDQASVDAIKTATLSWASQPVMPGNVLVLQGAFPPSPCEVVFTPLSQSDQTRTAAPTTTRRSGKEVTVTALQQTTVSCKVRVPSSLAIDAYNVSACGSVPITVNLPDVWWILGDGGDTATPGMSTR